MLMDNRKKRREMAVMSTNERIEAVIIALEDENPDVDFAIKTLKEILLQESDEDIWDSIKEQVASLIDEKILAKEQEGKKSLIEGINRTMKRHRDQ